MGHNLGMYHDFDTDNHNGESCKPFPIDGTMDYFPRRYTGLHHDCIAYKLHIIMIFNRTEWSVCSVSDFLKQYNSVGAENWCLPG